MKHTPEERRAKMLRIIRENPGITTRKLLRRFGWKFTTATVHLDTVHLQEKGKITRRVKYAWPFTLAYYPVSHDDTGECHLPIHDKKKSQTATNDKKAPTAIKHNRFSYDTGKRTSLTKQEILHLVMLEIIHGIDKREEDDEDNEERDEALA